MKRVAVLSAAIVLSAFASSGAHAADIHACVNDNSGTIRVVAPGATCGSGATLFVWNTTGPIGPQGPQGPQGPAGAAGPPGDIYFNRNCSVAGSPGCTTQALQAFPGVTVASLTLPPGRYVLKTKFRYLNGSASGVGTAGCVYQSTSGAIGGLDASQANVPPGGEISGQVDGYMMDIFTNTTAAAVEVHVQCFGPPIISIINAQFVAFPGTLHFQP